MAKLRYIETDMPGYTRKKQGRGFSYLDQKGEVIREPELRAWIESIVIPPAWTDVWISPYKNSHILATGRDAKGRKQYRYHPDWGEARSQQKFDELYDFGQCLPTIRQVTDEHLRQNKVSRQRVLAAIVRLLETTMIRIGNEEYTRENNSYGLTTMTDDHVEIKGSKIVFDYVGKSGKEHTVVLRDQRLARIVKNCRDIPGYELFQFYDDDGEHHVIDSADVNAYLHDITGRHFTAKVFRTWGGSSLAIKFLCEQCEAAGTADDTRECVNHVADMLGNTKAISRKYYIHPLIMEAHLEGVLHDLYAEHQDAPASKYDLTPEEKTLVALIERNSKT